MPDFQTHFVRFFVPEPKAVHCAALESETKKLAVSRSDNSVELWDVSCALSQRGAPVLQTRFPASDGASVEALAWSAGRLFSTGLHGHLLEHGGHDLEATASAAVAGGAAWCLAAAGRRLAVGTEDGQVVLMAVTEQGVGFDRRLAKQERRILCVAWSPDGSHLAAGSVNTVCLHHAGSGAQISRITVGRQPGKRETLVWSVALLGDLTVVTGDSRGRVSFWNGPLGALHISLNSHRADVLSVAASADGQRVFAAGVDPTVARFERVPAAREGGVATWVRSLRVQLHVRDVRVLLAVEEWVISAGVDAALVFDLQGTTKETIRTSPLPQLGTVLPAPSLPGLVTVSSSDLRLWRLPAADSADPPAALLQLSCRHGEPLLCAAVSADASWLAYGTPRRLRLHRLDMSAERPSLQRVRGLPAAADTAVRQLAFGPAGDWLLLLTAAGRLVRLWLTAGEQGDLSAEELGWADGRDAEDGEEDTEDSARPLDLLTVSPDGQTAALADRSGGLVLWDLQHDTPSAPLPRHPAPATALTFRPHTSPPRLLAAYADRAIVEFDTDTGRLTDWARWAARHVPDTWRRRPLPVRHVTVSGCGARVILHDDSGVCSLDAAAGGGERKRAKTARGRRKPAEVEEVEASEPVVITDKYRHLLYLGSFGGDQLLAVEAPAARVEEMLPPALRRKRYGVA